MSLVLEPSGAAPASEPVEGVAGVVVTFRPPTEFDQTLRSFVAQLPLTIVVSNDDDPLVIERVRHLVEVVSSERRNLRRGSLSLLLNRANRGLSVAFNQGVAAARVSAARYVLLLDQDTRLHPHAVRALVEDYRRLDVASSPGAVGCTNLEDVEISGFPLGALDRVRRMYRVRGRVEAASYELDGLSERPTMMNSGTMIGTTTLDSVGGFDEDLFLDAIDYDYSFRLRRANLHIFRSERAKADHSVGTPFEARWFGRTVRLRTYSTARSYYIVRDTRRLVTKWFAIFPVEVLGIGARAALGVVGSLVVLPERHARAGAILAALRDARSTGARAAR